jgi:hypothetical protein
VCVRARVCACMDNVHLHGMQPSTNVASGDECIYVRLLNRQPYQYVPDYVRINLHTYVKRCRFTVTSNNDQ